MKIINKDILTVESGVIVQQVNCQGVMGSGLAKSIKDKWPIVYTEYLKFSDGWHYDFQRLGMTNLVHVSDSLTIANCFGQLNYGYDGKRYTDYAALNDCFCFLSSRVAELGTIYFPLNFGCDRGGADWKIVSKMIDFYFPNAIICKL